MLEVPFCPDTGADVNIVGRSIIDELKGLAETVETDLVSPPLQVQVTGGATVRCREQVRLDLRITIAAGPLQLSGIEFLVMNGEDELLLGRGTLSEIGIDVDRLFEQLVERGPDEADDIDSEGMLLLGPTEDVLIELERMLQAATASGFDPACSAQLRDVVMRFSDVWRTCLGRDTAARVEPLFVQLRDDATPYRTGVRR